MILSFRQLQLPERRAPEVAASSANTSPLSARKEGTDSMAQPSQTGKEPRHHRPVTRGPRYQPTITVDGVTRPLESSSTYWDTLAYEAREAAFNGEPGTIARVTDTRTGRYVEYEKTASSFFSRAGVAS
jgi:hypothetical protein